jgi:hypothetical protein
MINDNGLMVKLFVYIYRYVDYYRNECHRLSYYQECHESENKPVDRVKTKRTAVRFVDRLISLSFKRYSVESAVVLFINSAMHRT